MTLTEHNFEDTITYKDLDLYNQDNAGRIIYDCVVNGKKVTLNEFKKSKNVEVGMNAILKFKKKK